MLVDVMADKYDSVERYPV